MSVWLGWDVLCMIMPYAASHSAARIALTCKRMAAFVRTKRFWQHALDVALTRIITRPIHPLQREAIDVFSDPPLEGTGLPFQQLTLQQRVGWLCEMQVRLCVIYAETYNGSVQEVYDSFGLYDRTTGRGVRWAWSRKQTDNFAVEHGLWDNVVTLATNLGCYMHPRSGITTYPLHATMHKTILYAGRRAIHEIYDPVSDITWIGDATLTRDDKTGRVDFVPDINGPGSVD